MTAPQPKPDPRPHRTAFYQVNEVAHKLSGDVVLVPDASDLTGITREELIKLSHWANKGDEGEHLLTPDNIDRLAVLTDGFFRFIDEGEDASVVTLWRNGTPIIQQIEGEPCEAAVDLVTDAVTGMRPLQEKWHGLPPLEAEIEILACRAGYMEGHRPKWLERQARRNLEERDVDPAATDERKGEPVAANDNVPQHDERLVPYLAAFTAADAFISGSTLFGVVVGGLTGNIQILADGRALFTSRLGSKFVELPVKPKRLVASPFRLKDPASIPEREWLHARHYIRRYLSITVGAGGGGKSAHAVSEALSMVTGRPLLDGQAGLGAPLRVWYVNAEDPQDEIDRRFVAAAKHFNVTEESIADRLFTDSGRDQEFVIMRQEGRDFKVCEPMVNDMLATIRENAIDIVVVDPFVSTHEVPENDNNLMQRVAKAWRRVADEGNCSVELIHHVTKGNFEVTADSARGGGALKDAARSVRTVNAMTKEEGEKAGLDDHHGFFRVDFGKTNMTAASSSSQWRRFVTVPLMNGKGLVKAGDEIGVVEPWRWPAKSEATAFVSAEELEAIKRKIDGGDCRDNIQSSQWAGFKVAEALRINLTDPAEKKRVRRMLEAWKEAGHFTIEQRPDYKGIERPCLVPVFHTTKN
ncbi:AAA family ATPase [Rhizobium ruizarguesonis]